MNKDQLIAYIYEKMAVYKEPNMAISKKLGNSFWRVYETNLASNDANIIFILDSFIQNSFKRQ